MDKVYVCNCYGISEKTVRAMANRTCFAYANLSTTIRTKQGSCCRCFTKLKEVISDENKKGESKPT